MIVAQTCASETVEGITYPETPMNSTYTGHCPAGKTGTITRFCTVDATWAAPVIACSGACE